MVKNHSEQVTEGNPKRAESDHFHLEVKFLLSFHTTSNGFSQKKFVLKTKRAEGNNNNFRAGGSGGAEKQISSISCLWVAGLKLRRPTKHVLWEKAIFRIFSHF